jgi:putative ATPase
MTASLFEHEGGSSPLAARMRPRTLEEFVGQGHVLSDGAPLRRLLDASSLDSGNSVIIWGPPGTGKTTLAKLVAVAGTSTFVELSAISAGVKDVRDVVHAARDNKTMFGTTTVLFIDEVHRFNKSQQDALLPGVENGWVTLVAATTENPAFSVVAPLLSRSLLITLEPLTPENIEHVITHALVDERGFNKTISLGTEAMQTLIALAGGDARRALTLLEATAAVALEQGLTEAGIEQVKLAGDHAIVRYDKAGDQHYDVISAFIKSVRGSDADAALHYLARMLEAGEDPRFIARRLLILASEDIGLADNTMLPLAVAGAQTVALIGMPEARIALSQVTIALCMAAKSNSAYQAIGLAIGDIRAGNIGEIPTHLRDSHYMRAGDIGHGVGYQYPHDVESGVAAQQYLPDALIGRTYYVPTARGSEAHSASILGRIKKLLGRN